MNKHIAVPAAVLTALLVASKPAAATEIYMSIPGIPGNATARGFQNDIELLSYSQSVQAPLTSSGTGSGAGKLSCGQITINKNLDKASPLLIRSLVSNHRLAQVVINFVETRANGTGQEIDYIVTLKDVSVTSVQQSDKTPSELTETVSFSATEFSIDYVPYTARGVAGTADKFSVNCATNQVS
jgi:type VI secretion system Hcp family effector